MELQIREEKGKLYIQGEFELSGDMLSKEEQIQIIVNEFGKKATEIALKSYDIEVSSLDISGVKYSNKGKKKE